eukprot:COSAG01_NODE_35961_length_524_cov_1.075294_1_plen_139_part_10
MTIGWWTMFSIKKQYGSLMLREPCVPYINLIATGVNTGIENTFCVPKYATQNGGMKNEPADVRVIVHDNDALSGQPAITPCRQTSLFSTSALESTSGSMPVAGGNQWLVDQNCQNGDAGGLPGYPVVTPLHGSDKPYVV